MARRLLLLALVAGAALAAGAGWLWWKVSSAPAWYAPPDADDPDAIALAERAEYRLAEVYQKVRADGDTWSILVPEEMINAWLALRLPEWMEHRGDDAWPDALGAPQVHVAADGLSVAVETAGSAGRRVVVAHVVPEISEGSIRMRLDRAGIGRFDVPAEQLVSLVERMLPANDRARRITGLLTGRESVPSIVELSDGRRVEVVGLALAEGAIELRNRTLPGAE